MSRSITPVKFVEHDFISPHANLNLWCNTPANFHSNPCINVGPFRTQGHETLLLHDIALLADTITCTSIDIKKMNIKVLVSFLYHVTSKVHNNPDKLTRWYQTLQEQRSVTQPHTLQTSWVTETSASHLKRVWRALCHSKSLFLVCQA